MVAFFIYLKAAFGKVNRECLWKTMRERGMRKELIGRVKEVYRETRSRARIRGKTGECLWTARGVRQGCSLSSRC